MATDGDSGSGRESSESDSSVEPKGKISEYEKQRFSRIAENKARLDALGISKAAKALMAPSLNSTKRRGKRNSGEQDDDYRPGDGDEDEEDEDEDEDEEFSGNSTCKRKASTSKRNVLSKKTLNRSDPIGDDDDLQKAIALSLQDSVPGGSRTTPTKKIRNYEEAPTWNKKKPELMSKIQMTDDELVIYFYQFDEAGKGFITLRDLVNMATVHDFTWTEKELQDMIRCFDIDKDGKLPTNMKGGNGKVTYIDTEGTFRPDRIIPIAERFGMDSGAVLDNIIYARAYTYEHQYNLLLGLAAKMSEEPFRILIVDSVIALFRVDFTGRGELADRQVNIINS